MRPLAGLVAILLLLPVAVASPLLVPQQGDPDVPGLGALVGSVQVFQDERWQFTEGERTRTLAVPDVAFDRVLLVWESSQVNEPWDRRFGVTIAGVEVLRGTTPRAEFDVTKDVTEFAALMPRGAEVPVSMHLGTWVAGYILASVRLEFYQGDPLAGSVWDEAKPFSRFAYMAGGATAGADLVFAQTAPSRAAIHFVTSGHGQEGEFWWMETPPAVANFRILVDGEEVAHATAMPYVYALIGFSPSTVTDTVVHPVMWWSAFQATDRAGVHGGVGEVPAYRAEIDASQLHLFTGERRIEVVQDTGAGHWVTSAAVLLDA